MIVHHPSVVFFRRPQVCVNNLAFTIKPNSYKNAQNTYLDKGYAKVESNLPVLSGQFNKNCFLTT